FFDADNLLTSRNQLKTLDQFAFHTASLLFTVIFVVMFCFLYFSYRPSCLSRSVSIPVVMVLVTSNRYSFPATWIFLSLLLIRDTSSDLSCSLSCLSAFSASAICSFAASIWAWSGSMRRMSSVTMSVSLPAAGCGTWTVVNASMISRSFFSSQVGLIQPSMC